MTDVNVLTAHKGWVWDERSLAVLLTAGHSLHRNSSQLVLQILHALWTGKCCSYRERVRWVKMVLGGDMTSFLERLPGAVAISTLCLLFQIFPGLKPRERIGSMRGLESGKTQCKSFLPRSLQASLFFIHKT